MQFINLTEENIGTEHLSCFVRKGVNEGIENKRKWLKSRIPEGHILRKLNVQQPCMIEYAPLEKAWVPIEGENFFYIYCLWTEGKDVRGKGYGQTLLEYCIHDAKANGKSGICVLSSPKKKHWLTSPDFLKKFDFKVVDTTSTGYEILSLSFDGTQPHFTQSAKKECIDEQELTIFYSDQCPFITKSKQLVELFCNSHNIPVHFNHIDTLEKAKAGPGAFQNWAVFYKGKYITLNLMNDISKIVK